MHREQAQVLGFDVIGFTKYSSNVVNRDRQASLEEITDKLNLGFLAVLEIIQKSGFHLGEILGDCLIGVRPISTGNIPEIPPEDLTAIIKKACRQFNTSTQSMRIRGAAAQGEICSLSHSSKYNERIRLLTGPAIERLHIELAAVRDNEDASVLVGSSPNTSKISASIDSAVLGSKVATAEIRHAMVVFCRLGSFSEIQNAPIEDVMAYLSMQADSASGVLEKFTHDDKGIIAHFSFYDLSEEKRNAVRTFIQRSRSNLQDQGLNPAFGAATGDVYLGPMSLNNELFRTVYGPAVNLAAKRVLSGGKTTELNTPDIPRIPKNGKSDIYREISVNNPRYKQIKKFENYLERCKQGDSKVIYIEGEPGIGKSHLLDIYINKLDKHEIKLIFKCLPENIFLPLGAVVDISKQRIFIRNKKNKQNIDKIKKVLLEGWCENDRTIASNLFDEYFDNNSDMKENSIPISGSAKRGIFEKLIVSILKPLPGDETVVILIDDLQWLDAPSADLLGRFVSGNKGILATGFIRKSSDETRKISFGGYPEAAAHRVALQRISKKQLLSILSDDPDQNKISAGLADEISKLSGGNPLFAIQMATTAREENLSSFELSGQNPRQNELERIIGRRLDRLDDFEKLVLRIKSVVSCAISPTELRGILSRIDVDLDEEQVISSLERKAFLKRSDGVSAGTFDVFHGLIADEVSKRLPQSVRHRLSQQIARYYSRRSNIAGSQMSHLELARHWRQAGSSKRAAILIAGEAKRALNIGAYSNAVSMFDVAIEALDDVNLTSGFNVSHWLAWKASAHWGMGDIRNAQIEAKKSFQSLDSWLNGDRNKQLSTTKQKTRPFGFMRALALKRGRNPRRGLFAPLEMANAVQGEVAYFTGDVGGWFSSVNTALVHTNSPSGKLVGKARGIALAGFLAGLCRVGPASRLIFRIGHRRYADMADCRPLAYIEASEAVLDVVFGRFGVADERVVNASRHAASPREPHLEEVILSLSALSALFQGDWQKSNLRFAELSERALRRGNCLHEAWGYYGQAQALLLPGDVVRAGPLLTDAEHLLENSMDQQSLLICSGLRTKLTYYSGDIDAAFNSAHSTLKKASELAPTNFSSLEGYAAAPLVFSSIANSSDASPNVRSKALDSANIAMKPLNRFARLVPIGRPRRNYCASMICLAMHRKTAALKYANRALDLAKDMGMAYEVKITEDLLAKLA